MIIFSASDIHSMATKMFKRFIHSHSFICIDWYLFPVYLIMICPTSCCAYPFGATCRPIREVVKRKSHGVFIFTSYFCVYLREMSQLNSPLLSPLVIYFRSSFSGCVRLEGKVILWNKNIKCFAQKRFRRRHNVLIPRTDWYREQTDTLPRYTFRRVCDSA